MTRPKYLTDKAEPVLLMSWNRSLPESLRNLLKLMNKLIPSQHRAKEKKLSAYFNTTALELLKFCRSLDKLYPNK